MIGYWAAVKHIVRAPPNLEKFLKYHLMSLHIFEQTAPMFYRYGNAIVIFRLTILASHFKLIT